jgi:hypothetical protein
VRLKPLSASFLSTKFEKDKKPTLDELDAASRKLSSMDL